MKSNNDKLHNVLENNTFFFKNDVFEEKWEAYVSSIVQNLLILRNEVANNGIKKEIFVKFIQNKEYGIDTLLAITGLSKETFLRLVTFIRIYNDSCINKLVNREYWEDHDFVSEWGLDKIKLFIKINKYFAQGIVNLFFEGSTIQIIRKALPLFEYKKLDFSKISFKVESILDTIVRYKVKGSYSACKGNNPEALLESIFFKNKIKFERGKLDDVSRNMDYIIPNKQNPLLIIESSYIVTTSSGMGDKAKTEIAVSREIQARYQNAKFIGFVDGIGWYVRHGDLQRIVSVLRMFLHSRTVNWQGLMTFLSKCYMENFENTIILGDCLEILKKIDNNTIDVIFADPPFNLRKDYDNFDDKNEDNVYLKWCFQWIKECIRVLKQNGTILLHNIPKWLIEYGAFLNAEGMYFRHWIAWDSMGSPLGKTLLPAHYGILYYTKSKKNFKFYDLRVPHKRCPKCKEVVKDYGGKKNQMHPFGTILSDVWSDIHRIRHTKRRDKHPCQLPEPLLERLILMCSDERDIVLDPFIGSGTTALAAKRLNRKYIGVDNSENYVSIARQKLQEINQKHSNGYIYQYNSVGQSKKSCSKNFAKQHTLRDKEIIINKSLEDEKPSLFVKYEMAKLSNNILSMS